MRRILAPQRAKPASAAQSPAAASAPENTPDTLEFELKRKIYSMAADKAAADGVICGYEEPKALEDARRIVLHDAVVKATTFEELKAIVTMMLDSNDGLVEGLAEIRRQLGK
jgi:hypothetical protein